MKHIFILLGSMILLSCSGGAGNQEHQVYWVNSTKVSCVGLTPMKCLQIQKTETLDPTKWESFHGSIQGFEYEAGYIYKIVVMERQLDEKDVPADASSIEYTLVEILEKRQDLKLRINDIWIVTALGGEPLEAADGQNLPSLEINVGDMRYMGSDACNNYNGGIIALDEHTVHFGIAAGTRMLCEDMRIPDLFNTSLPEVRSWEIQENKLKLFDADGKKLMELTKMN